MRQVRKMTVGVTVQSGKKLPFLVEASTMVRDDKFIIVAGGRYSPLEVSRCIQVLLENYLESNLIHGTGKRPPKQ